MCKVPIYINVFHSVSKVSLRPNAHQVVCQPVDAAAERLGPEPQPCSRHIGNRSAVCAGDSQPNRQDLRLRLRAGAATAGGAAA